VGTRRYVLGRMLQALLTLGFVVVFNFFLFRVIPSDPLELLLQEENPFIPPDIGQLTQELGLDRPLPVQFLMYAQDTLALEFGDSFSLQGQDVEQVISRYLWPTLLLIATSTIASAAIGLLIGIYAGWRPGSRFDVRSQGLTMFVYAMPEFWFGILVLMAFAEGVGSFPSLFPAGGYSTPGSDLTGFAHVADVLNHLALPWFVLTVTFIGQYALIMRNSMIGLMNDHFVMTARAKGVREKQILWRHVVPNALLPTFTILLLSLGFVFGGLIAVEYVFSYPGLGLLTVRAIKYQDLPLLQGLFLLFSAVVIVANFVADILYAYLDPRIRATALVHRSRDRADVMLLEISPDGALAGRVFSLTLLASAVGLIVLSWDDVWRVCGAVHGECVELSAGAMILTMGSIAAIAWGVGILVRIRRRPLDPAGSSLYVWALGVLFALGSIFIAGRIPAFTCDRGRFDDVLTLCMHPPSISDARSWLLLKKAIVVIGLLGALLVSVRPRNVKLTVPVSVAAWGIGFGWLIADTMG
jgi:peptide/nickel transport system permease protein